MLVGWGSTRGPIRGGGGSRADGGGQRFGGAFAAYQPAAAGLDNIFAGFNHVFVVEMNDEGLYGYGQLAAVLRARFCDPKIRGLNKTDGLTFRVRRFWNARRRLVRRVAQIVRAAKRNFLFI